MPTIKVSTQAILLQMAAAKMFGDKNYAKFDANTVQLGHPDAFGAMTNPTSPVYLPEPFFHEETGLRSREYWSQLIAIIITMPINFIVNKLWTFRAVRAGHQAHHDAPEVEAAE